LGTRIDFVMGLSSPYSDGFNFSASCDAEVEFNLTSAAGGSVLVGANRELAPASFSLSGLGVCTALP
jgi:hypothetical protein